MDGVLFNPNCFRTKTRVSTTKLHELHYDNNNDTPNSIATNLQGPADLSNTDYRRFEMEVKTDKTPSRHTLPDRNVSIEGMSVENMN